MPFGIRAAGRRPASSLLVRLDIAPLLHDICQIATALQNDFRRAKTHLNAHPVAVLVHHARASTTGRQPFASVIGRSPAIGAAS
jgi:hypothetical protein